MKKIYGAKERQDGLFCIGRNKWELIFGFGKDAETDETGYNYRKRFAYKPTLDEIKEIIVATINAEVDQKILNGFKWRDMPVWLSTENQFNYKAAYDLSVQTNGATLPVKFKFGTDTEPIYFVFDNMADFSEFYTSSLAFVKATLDAGWEEKDNIDLSVFN